MALVWNKQLSPLHWQRDSSSRSALERLVQKLDSMWPRMALLKAARQLRPLCPILNWTYK